MSDDTIVATLDDGIGRHELVIRRHRPVGILRDQTDPVRHFEILRALEQTPVPAPRVLWFESDSSVLGGRFFVMERLPGKAVVPWSTQGRFLDLYEEASGSAPDRGALPFWKLLSVVSNVSGWLECVEVFRATRGLRFARMSYTVPAVRRLVAEALEYP